MRSKGAAARKNSQEIGRSAKHGIGTSRLCLRFAKAVVLLSLLAFAITASPLASMLGAAFDRPDDDGPSRERFVSNRLWLASKAVIEERPTVFLRRFKSPIIDQDGLLRFKSPTIDQGEPLNLSSSIKVYIYDLPSSYNTDWLADKRCSSHLFAAEVAIHQNLLRSPVRTMDPTEADFFFMPVYVSCNFSSRSGFPTLFHAAETLESAVGLVSRSMPHWNRHQGRDHVFVATHDFGACFHAMEDLAVANGIPQFLRNSIILQTFGLKSKHPCQNVDHIQIPPYVVPSKKLPDPRRQKRKTFAFFRGKMEIHPKNVSGHVYSRGVRTIIWRRFSHDRRFSIKRKRSDNYKDEMLRSVFCLCPLGWAPWSPRIVESVIQGCIPVIIADKIRLPYSHVVDWRKISVTVAERDVYKLDRILSRVAATNLSMIQANLWRDEVRQALVYNQPLVRGDATWQVLDLLSKRRRAAGQR